MMKKQTLAIAALLSAMTLPCTSVHGADLKQLAEQLVGGNAQRADIVDPPPRYGASQAKPETKRGAHQADSSHGHSHENGIAIQEEGANVKKEKGVEDVE